MIYDYFRVTGAHDTVLDYADLFSVDLRNDDVMQFSITLIYSLSLFVTTMFRTSIQDGTKFYYQ